MLVVAFLGRKEEVLTIVKKMLRCEEEMEDDGEEKLPRNGEKENVAFFWLVWGREIWNLANIKKSLKNLN